jgi:hypothetical protein
MAEAKEELFGFELVSGDKKRDLRSPVPISIDDGTELPVGGRIGYTYEGYEKARTEHQLIAQYREISFYPEADAAIDDIVNEAFVVEHHRAPVSLRLDYLNVDDRIKESLRKEFQNVLGLLKFQKKSYDTFRNWYVDGRLFYQLIVDGNAPNDGIQEIRPIDALKIRRVVKPVYDKDQRTGASILQDVDEHFEFSPDGDMNAAVKLSKDSVAFCASGLVDRNKGMIIGHLDKAIKPFNNLRSMEDALIVYRIARAPERRIFYVDVGQLPKIKAEQYLRDMQNRFRNKIDYDPTSGNIRDSRRFMSILEDFWLPRREGSKGTEIDTLPGGQNLGELDDVQYFKNKLYESLNVPQTRINGGDASFQIGRATDITRDELKFGKFVQRLKKQFSEIFNEIMRVQCSLKGICTANEYDEMRQYITYDFVEDTHFQELKELELLQDRMNMLQTVTDYVGKYYSLEWVRKTVLGQSEEDIARMDSQIMDEIAKGQINTEEDQNDLFGG